MINKAKGIDDSVVDSSLYVPESISNEITLEHDISKKEQLYPYLMSLCETVAIRLRKQKKYASVICVILKDNYFKRKSHQKKILNATNVTDEIYKYCKEILDEMYTDDKVRLIGVRLDKLVNNVSYQASLFDTEEKVDKVDDVLDSLKQKYGNKIITKASLKDSKTIGKL